MPDRVYAIKGDPESQALEEWELCVNFQDVLIVNP